MKKKKKGGESKTRDEIKTDVRPRRHEERAAEISFWRVFDTA